MHKRQLLITLSILLAVSSGAAITTSAAKTILGAGNLSLPTSTTATANTNTTGNSVVISGGFETDPQDHGRPVVLIAAALGVPTEVFRKAFSGVHPAGLDSGGPTSEEAQSNKAALLSVLEPYGITNERLDEVSNYYRYNGSNGEIWTATKATATTVVTNGMVTGVTLINAGSGYSSAPTITVTGPNGTFVAKAALAYTTDFKTNGSIKTITLTSEKASATTAVSKGRATKTKPAKQQGTKPVVKQTRKPAPKTAISQKPTPTPSTTGTTTGTTANTVVISGGFETDQQDHGRPVVLVAAALGVPTEVFREAFSGVHPAGLGSGGPTSEEAQSNKAALMSVLSPYGISNERLDEASNYYRYNGTSGAIWTHTQATATAIITNGVVTGVKITNAGAGYSSTPTITVTGPNGKIIAATATVIYTSDFKTNGSISAITLK